MSKNRYRALLSLASALLLGGLLAIITAADANARPDLPRATLPEVEGGPCPDRYIIRPGDTLGELALICATTLADILAANPQITNPNIIHVGDVLDIPDYTGPPIYTTHVTVPAAGSRPRGIGPGEKWVDVDLGEQFLVAYQGNTPVFQSLISSGTRQYPTVTGLYRVNRRYVSKDMDGRPLGYDYYLPDVPFAMYFYRAYALHGTYWHGNYGSPMSHGCVNLPIPAAEWIFNWSELGLAVNVHH